MKINLKYTYLIQQVWKIWHIKYGKMSKYTTNHQFCEWCYPLYKYMCSLCQHFASLLLRMQSNRNHTEKMNEEQKRSTAMWEWEISGNKQSFHNESSAFCYHHYVNCIHGKCHLVLMACRRCIVARKVWTRVELETVVGRWSELVSRDSKIALFYSSHIVEVHVAGKARTETKRLGGPSADDGEEVVLPGGF
jgi:hypothetical protein